MNYLTVFYDDACGLCRACRSWLGNQPAFLELRFLPFRSREAQAIFPSINSFEPERHLVVLSDEGGVYTGGHAWIMCFYALKEYREWSQRLAHPLLVPLAERACQLVAQNRLKLSTLLRLDAKAAAASVSACDTGACEAWKA